MTLYTGAFSLIVASAAAAIATGWSESCRAGFALLKTVPLHGALKIEVAQGLRGLNAFRSRPVACRCRGEPNIAFLSPAAKWFD
jgi:hypothetical protein